MDKLNKDALNILYNEMIDSVNSSKKLEKEYYAKLKDFQDNCNHKWIKFGFDYKCEKCDKLDY